MPAPSPVRIAIDLLKPTLGSAVHAGVAPQGSAMPYVLVHLVGWEDERILEGLSDSGRAHILLTILGSTFAQADETALGVINALNGFSGVADGWHVQVLRDGPAATDWIDRLQAHRQTITFELAINGAAA
jgi:hypothetical protein